MGSGCIAAPDVWEQPGPCNSRDGSVIDPRTPEAVTANRSRRLELCVKIEIQPRVTHGTILRDHCLELLMGEFYAICTMPYSWHRITWTVSA